MKIQLSPNKIVKDALCVWNTPGPEVDIVMDLKNLTFRDKSIEGIFAFHILDHLFPHEVFPALKNWESKLVNGGGFLFIIVDDYEFIARAFVGGDIDINMVNESFTHPTQFTKDNMIAALQDAGFHADNQKIWYTLDTNQDFKYARQPHELVMSAEKP